MQDIAREILQYSYLYWIVAVIMSIFWGYFGVKYEELNEVIEVVNKQNVTLTNTKIIIIKQPRWYQFGTFLSDGMLSLVGWSSLYILLVNLNENVDKFTNFNIFLGTISVICITGYGYKISEKLK